MSTFYLLPPRACLDERVADLFAALLPGLPLPADTWDAVAGELAAHWPADVYLVPRDDLPDGEPAADALVSAFGAEPGDRVVEVGLPRAGGPAVRTWVVAEPVSAARAA